MKLEYDFQYADYRAMSAAYMRRGRARKFVWTRRIVSLFIWATVGFLTHIILRYQPQWQIHVWPIFWGFLIGLIFMAVIWLSYFRSYYVNLLLDKQKVTVELSANSVRYSVRGTRMIIEWGALVRADKYKDYRFLWISWVMPIIFPARCFNGDEEISEFETFVEERMPGRVEW